MFGQGASLLCVVALFVQSQSVKFARDEVDSVIQETFSCRNNNPGLAVAVVKDGKVVFSKGYGVTDLTSRKAVTVDTLFGIASISKSFAATLLVKLLMEKDMTVDDKVRSYLGERFKMPDDVRTKETTFADLMAHRTAVPPHNRLRFSDNLTRDNLVEHFADLSAPHQFRVKYFYSNIMYGLVTYLAQSLGGDKWERLVERHLFKPLHMDRSTFATEADFSRADIATGYTEDKFSGEFITVPPEFSKRWGLLAGSGAVITSAKDMTKWMNFHLSGGKNEEGVEIMQKDHLKEVHAPRFRIDPTSDKDTRKPTFPVTASSDIYAHGLRRGFYRGYERLGHTGATFGYRAMMSLLPDQKVGVFTALTGRDDNFSYRVPLHMYLLDMALGLQPWLNSSTICSYPAPWKKPKKSSETKKLDANLKLKRASNDYVGTYYNKGYGYLTVEFDPALKSLMMTYGWGAWRLYRRPHLSGDKFYGKGQGVTKVFDVSPIEFRADSKGNIVDIKAIAFETKSPPIFKKLSQTKKSPSFSATAAKSGRKPATSATPKSSTSSKKSSSAKPKPTKSAKPLKSKPTNSANSSLDGLTVWLGLLISTFLVRKAAVY